MARDPDKYVAAPGQSKYSAQMVNRALYWIRSQAHDVARRDPADQRKKMAAFKAKYDALESLNYPIHCKTTGKRAGKPVIECFKHPPLDTNPARKVKPGTISGRRGRRKTR